MIEGIVIESVSNQMEIDDASRSIENIQKSQKIFGVSIKNAPKTAAERGREFRARKALLKQQNKQLQPEENQIARASQISIFERRARSAAATRRWRERNKGLRESPREQENKKVVREPAKKQAKTTVQRMREYRERKKLAKKVQLKQQSGQQNLDAIDNVSIDLYKKITNSATDNSNNYNTSLIPGEEGSVLQVNSVIENTDLVEEVTCMSKLAQKIKEEPSLDIVDIAVVYDHADTTFTDEGTGRICPNKYIVSFITEEEEDNFQINTDIQNIDEVRKLNKMNTLSATVKVELDIDDSSVLHEHYNTKEVTACMPLNSITSGKRQTDDTNQSDEQSVKKLKLIQQHDNYIEEQQQWAAALKNDMINTHFGNGDIDSDNFNAENDDEDAHTVSNGKSTVAAAPNDSRAQYDQLLKLLTKHKLQSYFPKLKEMQITVDYLRFIQEVDIIDIFERDIGARIRFRGLLEDWRVSQRNFKTVLNRGAEFGDSLANGEQNQSSRPPKAVQYRQKSTHKKILPDKPFQSVLDFKLFEELIKNSEQAYTNLIDDLTAEHTNNSVSFLKSSWRRIMSDDVAQHFCWSGTLEKPAIREMGVTNALREAFRRNYD